jgi:hypothetical protein
MLKITTNWHKHSFQSVPPRQSDVGVDKNVACLLPNIFALYVLHQVACGGG